MGALEHFDYSTIELLPDFDHLISMETISSSADYMYDTIEAVRLNEWMSLGEGVHAEDQQAMDDQLQYDQWWKDEKEFISFSTCDLEASQKESLLWSDHDHPVLHSMDFLNSSGPSIESTSTERKSNLPNLSQRDYLFSDGSNHDSSQGLKFYKSARSAAGKNLISEKQRRIKVKQSLYTLRSVVPFITKMDKASIVKDATTYIQHLQNQVKEIECEIVALQSNNQSNCSSCVVSQSADMNALQIHEDHVHPQDAKPFPMPLARSKHGAQTVIEVDVCKIEGRTFRMTIYCLQQPCMLVQITKALESLQALEVKTSNILTFHDHIVLTVIAKTKEGTQIMEADELKQMILHAASRYGFAQEL